MQIQNLTTKKFKPKDSKPINTKTPALSHLDDFIKFNCQEKKKKYQKKNKIRKLFLAIQNNTIEDSDKKKKSDKNCYNYLKKSYFIRNCLEFLKNQYWS